MDYLRIRKQRNLPIYHIHDTLGNIISSHNTKREANKQLKTILQGGVRLHPKIKEHYDYLISHYTPEYLTKLANDILNYGTKKVSKLAYEVIKILGITIATFLAHQLLAQFGLSDELTRHDYQTYINSLPTKKM